MTICIYISMAVAKLARAFRRRELEKARIDRARRMIMPEERKARVRYS